MFAIEVESEFTATHQLRLGDGSLEARHGHVWRVTVRVEASGLDALGTVVDFHEVQEALGAVVKPWNNGHLNDVAPFDGAVNPSAERVAERIAELLGPRVAGMAAEARLVSVRVTEAPGCAAFWLA